MRITVISRTYDFKEGGGAVSSNLFVDEMNKKHALTVVSFDGSSNNFFSKNGVKFIQRKTSKFYPPVTLMLSIRAARIMKKLENQTDIFYISQADMVSSGGFYKLFSGKKKIIGMLNGYTPICPVFQCSLNNKPCKFCTFHNNRFYCVKKFSRTFWERYIFASIYALLFNLFNKHPSKRLDAYIALSEATKKVYSDFGFDKNKIIVIPNMVDVKFANKVKKIKKDKSKNFRILYVGRIKPSKGVDILVKAFEKLEINNKELTIIGSGISVNELKKIISKSKNKNKINFKDYVNYDNLPKYYKNADVFVHPSIWPEPFGRTIIEAIAAQTPIIVSNIGAPPEIINGSGLTFKPGDIDDLKRKLEFIFSNEKANLVPPLNLLNKYNSKKIIKETELLFKRVFE